MLAQRYAIGIKRHWKQLFSWVFCTWGVMWLVVESLSFLIPEFKETVENWNLETIGIFISFAALVIILRLPVSTRISFHVPTTNTKIEVQFSDLFESKGHGHLAIPVNEFFDGQLGEYVAPSSVHGQFIQNFFQGSSSDFESLVDEALVDKELEVKERSVRRNKSYPIGTTAVLKIAERKSFLFVAAMTDLQTAKAYANVSMMWKALEGLWQTVRASSDGDLISMPLVGGGQSQVGLEPLHLLRIILLSVLVATRETEITKTIRVVIHEDLLDRIDLDMIKREWS